MQQPAFPTPILFMIFNRPAETARVFERIRDMRPAKLFVAADGPRPGRPEDAENCRLAREAVMSRIDWPCEVKTLFRERNLGCRNAPSSAITWFFEHVEEGIILEDDCLPDPSFFPFCAELLERYRHDERVFEIAGSNLQQGNDGLDRSRSYFFSLFPSLWGWATWRRAWKHYDIDMKRWPSIKQSGIARRAVGSASIYEYWERLWDTYYGGVQNSWDRPWALVCLERGALTATSTVNLISNIGFGAEGTHTKNEASELSELPTNSLSFPFSHPARVEVDRKADVYGYRKFLGIDATMKQRITGTVRRRMPKLFHMLKTRMRFL